MVLGGDVQAYLQAKYLFSKGKLSKKPIFINTVESDFEAGQASEILGFILKQCTVGDKWILWEAYLNQWQAKYKFYKSKKVSPNFDTLLENTHKKLLSLVANSQYSALIATKIITNL